MRQIKNVATGEVVKISNVMDNGEGKLIGRYEFGKRFFSKYTMCTEDVAVDEPYCWRCHNVFVDNLNYGVSVGGNIDADNHPTDENLSVQVYYFDGIIEYIKDIEIIK